MLVEYTKEYVDRCLRQHQTHNRKLDNGDKLITVGGGLYDLFVGRGWSEPIRFRIVHLRQQKTHQLIQVSGPTLSRDYRTYLFKELIS